MKNEKKDLNLVISIKDLYVDYEDEGVQDAIFNEVETMLTRELVAQFSQESRKQLADKVTTSIDEKYSGLIEERIVKSINTGTIQIKSRRYGGETSQTLESYISEKFSELIKKEYIEDIIEEQVGKMWDKFKERYDAKFAAQIITKLKEAEMLTDDASKFLLDK